MFKGTRDPLYELGEDVLRRVCVSLDISGGISVESDLLDIKHDQIRSMGLGLPPSAFREALDQAGYDAFHKTAFHIKVKSRELSRELEEQ